MAKSLAIRVFSAIVLLIITAGSDLYSSEKSGKNIIMSANRLYNEYLMNEVGSDIIYKGEKIEIHGIVYETDRGEAVADSISLWTDKDGSVQCMYGENDKEKVRGMRRGVFITVRGECAGKMGRHIIIKDCLIE